jgi:hypothetical protein
MTPSRQIDLELQRGLLSLDFQVLTDQPDNDFVIKGDVDD